MSSKRLPRGQAIALFAVALAPALLLVGGLDWRERTHMVRRERHEIGETRRLDLNRDGKPETTSLENYEFVVKDGDRQLLRAPYDRTDGTFRSHAAWSGNGDRLVLFHPAAAPQVFVSEGGALVETSPSKEDREILDALATLDETGTMYSWDLYSLMRIPLMFIYSVLVFSYIARRMTLEMTRKEQTA